MGSFNRHTRYKRNHLPRTKRATQIYGESGDTGKFYRCRFCGFINDIDSSALADTADPGDSYPIQEYDGLTLSPQDTGDVRSAFLTLDSPMTGMTMMLTDPAGVIITIDRPRYPNVTRGCPQCGSLNWK